MGIYTFDNRIVSPIKNPWGTIIEKQYTLGLVDWTLGGVTGNAYIQTYSDRFRFGQSPSDTSETNLSLDIDLTWVDFLKIEWAWVSDSDSYHDATFRVSGGNFQRYYRTTWGKRIDTIEARNVSGIQTIQLAARRGVIYDVWRIWGINENDIIFISTV